MAKSTKKTFTLIEIVVTIAITLVGILGVISAYFSLRSLVSLARNTSLAARVASAKLEDIRGASIQQIKDEYINSPAIFSPKIDDPFPADINYQNLDYRGIIYVAEDSSYSNLIEVSVVICWREGQRVVGQEWVFEADADPSVHSRPTSPVTITTLMVDR